MASKKSLGYYKSGVATAKTLLDISGLAAYPTGTNFVDVIAETQACRYRDDAVDPTATDGMYMAVGTKFTIPYSLFAGLKFIQTTATAVLHVTFYK